MSYCTLLYLSGHDTSMILYFFVGLRQQQSIWWLAVLILQYILSFVDRYCPLYIYIFNYITFVHQMLIIYFLDIPQLVMYFTLFINYL